MEGEGRGSGPPGGGTEIANVAGAPVASSATAPGGDGRAKGQWPKRRFPAPALTVTLRQVELFALDFEDGERVLIDVEALNAALDRLQAPVLGSAVNASLRDQLTRNGIEPDYLAKLRAGEPDFRPATIIERGGVVFVVDGNHRAALWIEAGSKVIPVRLAHEPLWRSCTIPPEEVLL